MNNTTNGEDSESILERKNFFEYEFNHRDNYPFYSSKDVIFMCDFCGRDIGWSRAFHSFEETIDHWHTKHFDTHAEKILVFEEIILGIILAKKSLQEARRGGYSN